MKKVIKLTESDLHNIVTKSVNRIINEKNHDTTSQEGIDAYNEKTRHSVSEWFMGKLDDIRHEFATIFGEEPSDEEYSTMLSILGTQARHARKTGNVDYLNDRTNKINDLRQKYDKGYNRRKYGYYR